MPVSQINKYTQTTNNSFYLSSGPVKGWDAVNKAYVDNLLETKKSFFRVTERYAVSNTTLVTKLTETKTFTESGQWVVPTGCTSVSVFAVGGGGSGAGYPSNGGYAGGGGGGGLSTGTIAATPGNIVNFTVGAGGIGSTSSSGAVGAGGDTIFGSIVAYGGQAGTRGSGAGGAGTFATGGAGGGDQAGGANGPQYNGTYYSGGGGGRISGGGGLGGGGGHNQNGSFYGAGGGGADSTDKPGNGYSGLLIITYTYDDYTSSQLLPTLYIDQNGNQLANSTTLNSTPTNIWRRLNNIDYNYNNIIQLRNLAGIPQAKYVLLQPGTYDIEAAGSLEASKTHCASLVIFNPSSSQVPQLVRETITNSQTWTVPFGVTSLSALVVGGGGGGNKKIAVTQIFDTSTTWTVPAGVTSLSATVVGAGGGGQGSRWNGKQGKELDVVAGAGGGSGGLYTGTISVTPGTSISITVGSGGKGGKGGTTSTGSGGPFTVADGKAGGAGGDSSFGSYTATGGGGGTTGNPGTGGVGGTPNGNNGANGKDIGNVPIGTDASYAPLGGASPYNQPPRGVASFVGEGGHGGTGGFYNGGGLGNDGGNGVVVVSYYVNTDPKLNGTPGAGGSVTQVDSYSVTPGSTIDVVVGTGGTGGTDIASKEVGTAGSQSSFGTLVANGGAGGTSTGRPGTYAKILNKYVGVDGTTGTSPLEAGGGGGGGTMSDSGWGHNGGGGNNGLVVVQYNIPTFSYTPLANGSLCYCDTTGQNGSSTSHVSGRFKFAVPTGIVLWQTIYNGSTTYVGSENFSHWNGTPAWLLNYLPNIDTAWINVQKIV